MMIASHFLGFPPPPLASTFGNPVGSVLPQVLFSKFSESQHVLDCPSRAVSLICASESLLFRCHRFPGPDPAPPPRDVNGQCAICAGAEGRRTLELLAESSAGLVKFLLPALSRGVIILSYRNPEIAHSKSCTSIEKGFYLQPQPQPLNLKMLSR
ncbi:hypothetical protein MPTK1_2g00900 [Marchantia polymorpha subsp. ruderalis]|uniref:Uncharacterized protein n=1 Tax=Marchantia polymorpha TaxID=3197 RepID=A0A2R6X9I0_MARPO|nr:hypothetical protein MARPO_0028s0061 [Marchantia polymorpha]BBN00652.1 hypothetical protein Mp_2g00900 [Marchantia polymorpha subsp. ruderalis]|eukprot:PTQ42744.1 hypothetical protein MARPO_0028s0061 [Marchantia polymorpha]